MDQILFEIPIYPYSEDDFNAWRTAKTSAMYADVHGDIDQKTRIGIGYIMRPFSMWRYNQIAGHIVITTNGHDILFTLYLNDKQRYKKDSHERLFVYDRMLQGMHFRCTDMKQHDIIERMQSFIDEIIDRHIPKRFYVDQSVFHRILPYIDLSSLINSTTCQ